MRKFTLPACIISLTLILAPAGTAARPQTHRNFPFSGAILWSDTGGRQKTGGQQKTRLHISTILHGRSIAERVVYEMSVVAPNGARLFELSPDGRKVLTPLPSSLQTGDGDLSVIDLSKHQMRQLTHTGDYNRYFPAGWVPDSRYVFAVRSGTQISVLDMTTGRAVATLDQAFAPVWTRDSRSVVFSRFLLDGEAPTVSQLNVASAPATGLQRQFWIAPIMGTPVRISERELDRRVGPAYLPAISVYQQHTYSDAGRSYWRDDPEAFQLSPDGSRAIIVTDVTLPEVVRIHSMGMIESPVRLDRTRFSLVGTRGVLKQRTIKGGYGLFRWSHDGRYAYGGGRDVSGRRVLIAIDSRTLGIDRLELGDKWENREIEDLRETVQP